MVNLPEYLKNTEYPGRGIMIGQSPNGENIVLAYFIMGRSENSKNRVFENIPGGIKTKAYDASKLTDPSLVIYTPVKKYKNNIIITNGDQTNTVYEFLAAGSSFENALRTRTFEPDPPILTPRISGLVTILNGTFAYRLSILKSGGNEKRAERYFFEYETPEPGCGHLIHTYKNNAGVPPVFEGEPVKIGIPGNMEEFSNIIWENLNGDFKVSLYVSYINIITGETTEKIINKNK